MAGGREYSAHQRKIIDRYYEHRGTIKAHRLGELVGELYLAEGKKAETLWKRVEQALAGSGADTREAARVLEKRDLEGLARLVGTLG